MENSGHRLSISQVYQLAHEYRDHAYSVASKISSEEELKQYYTLINMSIRMFQMLKGKCTLSVVEDSKITFEMVELLIHETHNFDLAELYISSLKERLQTHQNSMCVVEEVMHCEFLLVHDLPLMRDTKFHYKIALRNCNELVQYMTSLKDEVYQNWALVFQYVGVALCIKLKQHRRVKTSFAGLLSQCGDKSQWKWFLNLCYVNYLLNERFPIPEAAIEELRSTELDTVGPRLYAWKLALNMVIQVYKDGNITEHLNEFKRFFDVNKQSLVNDEDKGCMISIAPGVTLKVDLPIIFHYKELKNILLLLQSVSYIVNCYDGKGNFSRKFLPKVHSTTQKLMKTIGTGGVSMNELDSRVQTYKSILDFCDFYKVWEEILLNGAVVEGAAASSSSSSSSSSSNLGPSPAYTKLLQAMKVQFQGGGCGGVHAPGAVWWHVERSKDDIAAKLLHRASGEGEPVSGRQAGPARGAVQQGVAAGGEAAAGDGPAVQPNMGVHGDDSVAVQPLRALQLEPAAVQRQGAGRVHVEASRVLLEQQVCQWRWCRGRAVQAQEGVAAAGAGELPGRADARTRPGGDPRDLRQVL